MFRSGKVLIFLGLICAAQSQHAIAADTEAIRGERNDLGVKVVQNRYFIKQFRPEIGIFAGRFLNEAYTKTDTVGIRANFFFTEWFGLEVQGLNTSISDTEDLKALKQLSFRELDSERIVYPNPEINRIHATKEVNLVGVPFYGKLNFFDLLIVYTDLYLTAGATQVLTDQRVGPEKLVQKKELTGGSIGAGIRFFILKSASFQIDFRDRIYEEMRNSKKNSKHALSVDFGLSYFFF
jgi:outer membrane beta-barrel protein